MTVMKREIEEHPGHMEYDYNGNVDENIVAFYDSLHTMFSKEQDCIDYLSMDNEFEDKRRKDNLRICEQCRLKMCQWKFQVAEVCNFQKVTVSVAMAYLDRFISSDHPESRIVLMNRKKYQLAAMTCLYIAAKLFEPAVLGIKAISILSQGCYTEEDISQMELNILEGLGWKLHSPTSYDFVHYIIRILSLHFPDKAPTFRILSDFAEFMLELAISEYNLAIKRPSTIAVSAILNALECVDTDHFNVCERIEYIAFVQNIVHDKVQDPRMITQTKAALLQAFHRLSGKEMGLFATKLKNSLDSSQKDIQEKADCNIRKSPVCISRRNSVNISEKGVLC